jgi:hypothetical protein
MRNNLMREVKNLENVVFVCFGRPTDNDLPQISNDDDVVIDLMQEISGKPMYEIEAEFYHQIDTAQ